jgi:hypothetical protein
MKVNHLLNRITGEWRARGRRLPQPPTPAAPTTIAMMLADFWRHAQAYHRNPDGTPAGELDNYRLGTRPLHSLDGSTPAVEFGPRPMCLVGHRQSNLPFNCDRLPGKFF